MKTKKLRYILCFSLYVAIFASFGLGASAATISETKANINTVKNPSVLDSLIQTTIIDAGGEVKGLVGNIISNIFNAAGMIRNDFIFAFQTLNISLANNVLRWDGNRFIAGSIYNVGNNIGIGTANPSQTLDVRGTGIRIDHRSPSHDVWIQGGAVSAGPSRNLALLGSNDRLYVNYRGEYGNGTIIGGRVGIGRPPVAGAHLAVNGKIRATTPSATDAATTVATKGYVDSRVPRGTWCGIKMSQHSLPIQDCSGHNPQDSCPAGYTSKMWAMLDPVSAGRWYSCFKN